MNGRTDGREQDAALDFGQRNSAKVRYLACLTVCLSPLSQRITSFTSLLGRSSEERVTGSETVTLVSFYSKAEKILRNKSD